MLPYMVVPAVSIGLGAGAGDAQPVVAGPPAPAEPPSCPAS